MNQLYIYHIGDRDYNYGIKSLIIIAPDDQTAEVFAALEKYNPIILKKEPIQVGIFVEIQE